MKRLYLVLYKQAILFSILSFAFTNGHGQTRLLGLTSVGANGTGSIFSMPTGGTTFSDFYNLKPNIGGQPVGSPVTAPNGKIYWVSGGIHEYDYLTDEVTTKLFLGSDLTLRAGYFSTLTLAANGKFYSTSEFGGSDNSSGLIYEYDYINNIYTKKIDLSATTGRYPLGHMIEANGKMYGMTMQGGINDKGVIYEYDYVNNVYTKKIDLSSVNGSKPTGSLVLANGKMYGLTDSGGVNNRGVLFEYDFINNIYTKKFDMDIVNGANPKSSLLPAANGKLYGTTRTGGANGVGVIFEYDPVNSTYTRKVDLVSAVTGSVPETSFLEVINGELYALMSGGGFASGGTLIKYDYINNVVTKLKDFSIATGASSTLDGRLTVGPNGKLYGLNPLSGVPRFNRSGSGAMFEYDYTNNIYRKILTFAHAKDGAVPVGSLTLANNGKTYGLTHDGGLYNGGVIFEYDYHSNSYTKKYDIQDIPPDFNGIYPKGGLTAASNGKLYGTTSTGASFIGTIFEYDVAVNAFTVKLQMHDSIGGCTGKLIQASNGKLYGLTETLNQAIPSVGTIFEYDYNTNSCSKKMLLSVVNGSEAHGSLIQASNGKLYGMASAGGTTNGGVLFEYDYTSNTGVQKYDFNQPTNGKTPYGALIQASNGKLYGMTTSGGANGFGVIFEFDITNNVYTKKYDFDGLNGSNPYGDLLQSSNGKLYGMTRTGGTSNLGTVFEYDYNSNTYTVKKSFNGTDGSGPGQTTLIEVPEGPCSITPVIINNTGSTELSCAVPEISVTATGGLNYTWSNGLGNNANAIITAPGTYIVNATDAGGCTGTANITVTQIPSVPATPVAVQGATNVCPYIGTTTQLTYSIANEPVVTNYTWVIPPTVTLISGQGTNSIIVTINNNFTTNLNRVIKVSASSACGISTQRLLYLQAQPPSAPGAITAFSQDVCGAITSGNSIRYTIASVLGASSYNWNAGAGTIITHPNGTGVNDTSIAVTFTSTFVNSAITVQAVNNCGVSTTRSISIVRNNPAAPGLISGPTNSCEYIAPGGIAANYSVPNIAGNTYNWSVPAGASGLTGQGTNSISFIYPTGFTSGSISVTASNACGTSPARTLNINRLLPAATGNIGSILVQDCPDRIYKLIIDPPTTNTINWTVPAGATIVSGQGSNSVYVSIPPTMLSANITAQAISNCGNSSPRSGVFNFPACAPGAGFTARTARAEKILPVQNTALRLFPNPATNAFKLQLSASSKTPAVVIVSDIEGREIKRINALPGGALLSFGNELKPGTYLVQVFQDKTVQTIRAIKL